MRAWRVTVLAAGIAAAALGQAWKPGGEYSGSGVRTNATYDPFLGNILPYSANVQVVGRIATNDMAVFTDRSGRYVRGTNFIGMVQAAASNAAAGAGYATTGHVAAAGVVITTNLQAQIVASTQTVVQAASTVGWETGPHAAWLTNETDARALNALATNRVTRWYDPELSSRWAEWDGGTNIVIFKETVSGTNFTVELSSDFLITAGGGLRPDWTNSAFPFLEVMIPETPSDSELYGQFEESAAVIRYDGTLMFYGDSVTGFPVTLTNVNVGAQGTATVSIASFNLTTVVEWRYFLPTNAIPPELSNLDALQGWLNNFYAGKAALPYTAWTGTVTPADGTATVAIAHGNMPVLVTDAPCVLTLDPTGYGTAGVSRVSLSYYTGTNSFTFATNIIDYAATPTVDTNGWNTLLIRSVSDGAWKGVGL